MASQSSAYSINSLVHFQASFIKMISYEEACCIVFDLVPDDSNYHYVVEEILKTPFDVVYEKDKDPNMPIVLAKSIIKKN